MSLRDRVAIITGAGSGIGRASALLFAKEGAKVVVADFVPEGGSETREIILRNNGEAIFAETDVSKAADAKKMVNTAVQTYGKIDVLFNNAGINLEKKLADTSEQEWDKIINTNLKGVFLCSKYAIPEMIRNGGGVIINTASILGLFGQSLEGAYCASKAGVVLLTRAMALDYGRDHIRVNSICPGMIQTPMHESFLATLVNPEKELEEILRDVPLGRIGRPEDVAQAALFLASDSSSYLTGMALLVDGGRGQVF